jgi:cysteinyl-tRNA synthetase
VLEGFQERLEDVLSDDFNTPRALALFGEVARIGNELTESKKKLNDERAWTLWHVRASLLLAGKLLGLLELDPKLALEEIRDLKVELLGIDRARVEEKIEERRQARENKDWAQADAARDELLAMGIEIMDSPEGTTWRVTT